MNEFEKDVRLLRRNLAKGFISRQDIDDALAELPDTEQQAEWIDSEREEEDTSNEAADTDEVADQVTDGE